MEYLIVGSSPDPLPPQGLCLSITWMHGDADDETTEVFPLEVRDRDNTDIHPDHRVSSTEESLDRALRALAKTGGQRVDADEIWEDDDAFWLFWSGMEDHSNQERREKYDSSWGECLWPRDNQYGSEGARLTHWHFYHQNGRTQQGVEVSWKGRMINPDLLPLKDWYAQTYGKEPTRLGERW